MGPRCSSAETQVCHRSYIIAATCPWSVVLSGTPASSTTKNGRYDIAEILLKVALSTKNKNNKIDNTIDTCIFTKRLDPNKNDVNEHA